MNGYIDEETFKAASDLYDMKYSLLSALSNVPDIFRSSLAQVVAGGATAVGDILGRKDIVEEATGAMKEAAKHQEEMISPYTQGKRWLMGGLSSALQNISLIPIGMVTGPAGMVGMMGAMSASQKYGEMRSEQKTPFESGVAAAGYGISEAATEFLPTKWFLKGKYLRGAASEMVQEVVNTAVQGAIDVANKPDVGWGEFAKKLPSEILDTVVETAISLPLLRAAYGTANVARRRFLSNKIAEDVEKSTGIPKDEVVKGIDSILREASTTDTTTEDINRKINEYIKLAGFESGILTVEDVKEAIGVEDTGEKKEVGIEDALKETGVVDEATLKSLLYGEELLEPSESPLQKQEPSPEVAPTGKKIEGIRMTPLEEDTIKKGGEEYAEGIRGVEGQVYEGRTVEGQGTRDGGEDIQLVKEEGGKGVQEETVKQAAQMIEDRFYFTRKHDANLKLQELGEGYVITKRDDGKKGYMVRRKTEAEGVSPEKVEEERKEAASGIAKSSRLADIRRRAKTISEELFDTEEDAIEALNGLQELKSDFVVRKAGDIGYVVIKKEEAAEYDEEVRKKEEETVGFLAEMQRKAASYTPMEQAEIDEGLRIDIDKSGIGAVNILKGLKARIDDLYMRRGSGAQYSDMRDKLNEVKSYASGTIYEQEVDKLIDRLESAMAKAAIENTQYRVVERGTKSLTYADNKDSGWVKAAVSTILKKLGINEDMVVVHDNPMSFPEHAKSRHTGNVVVFGWFDTDGKVHLNAEAVGDERAVEKVILDELIGHGYFETALNMNNADARSVFRSIYDAYKNDKRMSDIIREYDIDISSKDGKEKAGKEFLAHHKWDTLEKPGLLAKIANAITGFLRRVGITMGMTRYEMDAFLYDKLNEARRLMKEAKGVDIVEESYMLKKIPSVKDIINELRNRRNTTLLYRDRTIKESVAGRTIEVSVDEAKDISVILPWITHAHLFYSKRFAPYRKYITDIASAYMKSEVAIAEDDYFLSELESKLNDAEIKELTRVGYEIDRMVHRLYRRVYKGAIKSIKAYSETLNIGMSKEEINRKAKDLATAKVSPLINRIVDKKIKDPVIKATYLKLRNEFFEPYKAKMKELMLDNLKRSIVKKYGKDASDVIRMVFEQGASITTVVGATGLKSDTILRIVDAYRKGLYKIKDWGELAYWSAYMPGAFLVKAVFKGKNGGMHERIVAAGKSLHEARLYAEDYARLTGISVDKLKIVESKFKRGRVISEVFAGPTKQTMRILKGLDNIFDTCRYYSKAMNRKLHFDRVGWGIRDAEGTIPPNAYNHIVNTFNDAKGSNVSIVDRILDDLIRGATFGAYTPYKSATKTAGAARGAVINMLLMYRTAASIVNIVDGMYRVWLDTNMKYMIRGRKFLQTAEGQRWIHKNRFILGMKAFELGGHITASQKIFGKYFIGWKGVLTPMGFWNQGEIVIRQTNAAAVYLKYIDDAIARYKAAGITVTRDTLEEEATRAVVESIAALQGLNMTPMLPNWMRGPLGRIMSPFRPFVTRHIEWILTRGHSLSFWAKYIPYITMLAGPVGIIKMIKSIPLIGVICMIFGEPYLFDKLEEYLRRVFGKASVGLPGMAGVDISDQVAVTIPDMDMRLTGAVFTCVYNIYKHYIEPIMVGDINKGAIAKQGIRKLIPAVRDMIDAIDSVVNEKGWVYGPDGELMFNIGSDWQRVLTGLGISKGIDRTYTELTNRLYNEIRKFENERVNDILNYYVTMTRRHKGMALPAPVAEKIQQMIFKYHISEEAFTKRMVERDMPPALKRVLEAAIKDKAIIFNRYIESEKSLGVNLLR